MVLNYIEAFIVVSDRSHKMSQRNSQSDCCQSKLGSLVRHRHHATKQLDSLPSLYEVETNLQETSI